MTRQCGTGQIYVSWHNNQHFPTDIQDVRGLTEIILTSDKLDPIKQKGIT